LANLSDAKLRPYFEPGRGRTIWLNLMEVYYALLRDGGPPEKAREVVAAFEPHQIDFSFEDVVRAMEMRVGWPRRRARISYVDAVNYHLATHRKMIFLTGDPAFRGLPHVAFIRVRGT
jgi:hypothetical protein